MLPPLSFLSQTEDRLDDRKFFKWGDRECWVRRDLNIDKPEESLTVDDVIAVYVEKGKTERIPQFPTLSICTGCGGFKSLYVGGREVKIPTLAFSVALVEYGYRTMRTWDNLAPSKSCDCGSRMVELGERIAKLKIVEDSGWGTLPSSAVSSTTSVASSWRGSPRPKSLSI